MALSLRLRRALTLSSSLLKDRYFSSIASCSPPLSFLRPQSPFPGSPIPRPYSLISSQSFRSSSSSFIRRSDGFEESKIDPDEILFEGCDYNHWLITIDFPKDPENKPTPEQMVETYVQTAAQVFGSVEEAKKRIYACSTTTYQGFQVVCDEATSEKFRGLPGVVFILPDSYIDPVNKEYGGDKYENGVITPRPPPVQYGRQGRYGDRNRNYDRQPRYDRPRESMPPQQDGGRGYGPPQQGAMGYGPPQQGARGYGPPQQDGRSYGPPRQDGRGYVPQQQDGRGYVPQQQDGRGYVPQQQDGRGYVPQQQDGRGYVPQQQDGRAYAPQQQGGRGYVPPQHEGRGYGQGEWRDQMPPHQNGFQQGQQGNLPPQPPRNFAQGPGGDGMPGNTEFGQQPPAYGYGGDHGQGSGYK